MPRMCCVPGCSSNYRSQATPTVTTFVFPKNSHRRQQWLKCIHRQNFIPSNSSVVCIKHFSEQFIVREDTAIRDDGTTLVVPRQRPKLTVDAYPSIFENLPAYLSTVPAPKRKLPDDCRNKTLTRDESSFKEWIDNDKIGSFAIFKDNYKCEITGGFPVERSCSSTTKLRRMEDDVRIKSETVWLLDHDAEVKAEPESAAVKTELVGENVSDHEMESSCLDSQENSEACEEDSPQIKTEIDIDEHSILPDSPELIASSGEQRSCSRTARIKDHRTVQLPFKCEVCNKRFSHPSCVVKHMRTHTGEKPFRCEMCNKCFSQSSEVIRHMRTHTGEKPFRCEVCNKCFSQSSEVFKHMRTHTGEKPFRCEVCNKCFSQSSQVLRHMRTHTGEKPYNCDVCNKCFPRHSALVQHAKTHTGEKPFQCNVCKKCFLNKGNLGRHMKVHRDK